MISSIIKFRQLDSWGFFSTLAFLALVSLSSCDSKEEPSPAKTLDIAGRYTLKKATLNEDLAQLKKGSDITVLFKGQLFSKITCKNENNLAIDLRKDNSLYVSCVGESNDLQGGTWNLPNDSTLVLNLNDKLVKVPFALTITDVKVEDGKITGNLVTPMVLPGNVTIIVKAHIEFHPFKEDEGTETPDDGIADSIPGLYTLAKATLNKEVSLGRVQPKGQDIADFLKPKLFGKVTCQNENNSAINLKEDKNLYVSCVGESNDQEGGTWNLPNNHTLVLNLSAVLTGFPLTFPLAITDLKIEDGKVTGNTIFSMPIEEEDNVRPVQIDIHIEFHPFKEEGGTETPDDSGADLVVGLYTLETATLNEDFLPQKKGDSITTNLEARLLGKVACGEDTPRIIELRKDKSIYVRCQGASNDQEGGTWSLTGSDTLVLNLNDKLVGDLSAGITFPLTITDLKVEGGKITGNTMLPVPGSTSLMNVRLEFRLFVPET